MQENQEDSTQNSKSTKQESSVVIKPYGDRADDGMVQLSFTLPTRSGPEAREAAIQLVQKMGFEKITIATMEAIAENFTFFVAYGKTNFSIDMSQIKVTKLENPYLNFDQINEFIEQKIGRKLVVVGACIGSDAHTVGIDAIFNMKGFAHDWGFERYAGMSAHNLRAQVAAEDLAKKLAELKADAVLISRVVTQRDEHITELKNFLEVLKNQEGIMPHLIKICGGPRLTHQDAVNLGYDAGFGPGTKPSEVGSFIVHEFHKRCPERYIAPLPTKPELVVENQPVEAEKPLESSPDSLPNISEVELDSPPKNGDNDDKIS